MSAIVLSLVDSMCNHDDVRRPWPMVTISTNPPAEGLMSELILHSTDTTRVMDVELHL